MPTSTFWRETRCNGRASRRFLTVSLTPTWESISTLRSLNKRAAAALAGLAAAAFLAHDAPREARAQRTEVRIGIRRGGAPSKLALRLDDWFPSGDMGSAAAAGISGKEVVRNDLTINGNFTLTGGPAPHDSSAAASFPEQTELSVGIRATGNDYEIHAVLYTLPARSRISDKTYHARDVQLRRIAHQISDDVVFQLTGEKGIAQTQIAFALQTRAGREIFMADYDGFNARQVTQDRNLDLSP